VGNVGVTNSFPLPALLFFRFLYSLKETDFFVAVMDKLRLGGGDFLVRGAEGELSFLGFSREGEVDSRFRLRPNGLPFRGLRLTRLHCGTYVDSSC
jgi:hypothetical protein